MNEYFNYGYKMAQEIAKVGGSVAVEHIMKMTVSEFIFHVALPNELQFVYLPSDDKADSFDDELEEENEKNEDAAFYIIASYRKKGSPKGIKTQYLTMKNGKHIWVSNRDNALHVEKNYLRDCYDDPKFGLPSQYHQRPRLQEVI